jgi:Sec-independent protein translocase protein TatA
MFGLGFIEILVIFLAVIVFINPKDLPKFFRKIGRLYQQIRDIRNKSVQYMKQIEQEIEKAGQAEKVSAPDHAESGSTPSQVKHPGQSANHAAPESELPETDLEKQNSQAEEA